MGHPIGPFLLYLSWLTRTMKAERLVNVCVSRCKRKRAVFVLSSVSPFLVRTKHVCMHELQNINCVIWGDSP